MSRLAPTFQRASRGSSRGISYFNSKNSNVSYGMSSKKDTKLLDTKILKPNTPGYSSVMKTSLKEKNPNIYESSHDR